MSSTVKLPLPPSANDLWCVARTRKGRASVTLQAKYKTWLDEAILLLRMGMAKVRDADYPVQVFITVHRGDDWDERRDIDNLIKPTVDAVKKAGRIVDDRGRYVCGVHAVFGADAGANTSVSVTLAARPGAAA